MGLYDELHGLDAFAFRETPEPTKIAICYLRHSPSADVEAGMADVAAQKAEAVRFAASGYLLMGDFIEQESGRGWRRRPALAAALAACAHENASLIVPRAGRLLRSTDFLSRICSQSCEVRFCELPNLQGHIALMLLRNVLAFTLIERPLLARKTQEGMKRAVAEGKHVGRPRVSTIDPTISAKGVAARQVKPARRADRLQPILREIRTAGITSLQGIADALTRRRILTMRGGTTWSPIQVSRVLDYYDGPKKGRLKAFRKGKRTRKATASASNA